MVDTTYAVTQNNVSLIPQLLYNFYNTDTLLSFMRRRCYRSTYATYSGNKYIYTMAR
jgi:hypothetical protein